MSGYLLLQPLIFGRWDLSLSVGNDERGYYTRLDMAGEWLIAGEDMALIFVMPFVYNSEGYSLTDTKMGAKVRFLEQGFISLYAYLPTGKLSSRNPGAGLKFLRYIKRDSSFGILYNLEGIFTASMDTNEYAFYNKVSERRAYRHMVAEILMYKGIGETMGMGFGIRGDYAYSLNQVWMSLNVGFYIAPYIEIGGRYYLYKPRPEIFGIYILGNFFI